MIFWLISYCKISLHCSSYYTASCYQ